MKTTLVIADSIFARLKEEAARSGRTISELVEAALRLMLERRYGRPARKRPLPSFDGGRAYVDVANREALYQVYGGALNAPGVCAEPGASSRCYWRPRF